MNSSEMLSDIRASVEFEHATDADPELSAVMAAQRRCGGNMDHSETEDLVRENARLQAEITHLKAQNEQTSRALIIECSWRAEAVEELRYWQEERKREPSLDWFQALTKAQEAYIRSLRGEIGNLSRRLDTACHIRAGDRVDFDWAVLDKIFTLERQVEALTETLQAIAGGDKQLQGIFDLEVFLENQRLKTELKEARNGS